MKAIPVVQLPTDLSFESDSQVVEAITRLLQVDDDYGSYFVRSTPRIKWGEFAGQDSDMVYDTIKDYTFHLVYGLTGIVPYNHKLAWRIKID